MPVFVAWLQEPSFLPDGLAEWLAAIATLGTLVVMVYGLFRLAFKLGQERQAREDAEKALRTEIDRRFREHGERIGDVESGCERNGTAVHALENRTSMLSLEVGSNTREVSSLGGKVQQLETTYNQGHQVNTEARALIRERIARLEAVQQQNRGDG